MFLNNKPLDLVEESDLQSLIEDKIAESKVIDYKRCLPGSSDLDKKEFLRDVSSFANASGGYLIYGIEEEKGEPVRICGLHGIDPDKEILRLESIVRTGIAPRIQILIDYVTLENGNIVILVRIPKSWASPHMVTKGSPKFYSRNSKGRWDLDVSEIRSAFLLSETTAERIRDFRAERLSKIMAGDTPTPLNESPKSVLHVIPIAAFDSGTKLDISAIETKTFSNNKYLLPTSVYDVHRGNRYNFDGLLTYDRNLKSYVQLFRNGIIEVVDSLRFYGSINSHKCIHIERYEHEMLKAIDKYVEIEKQLGVDPPFFLMISLLGVNGVGIFVDDLHAYEGAPIDRDVLLVPEILVENFDYELDVLMKPAFDAIWNAAGWKGSFCYNEHGRRVG